MIFSRTAP